MEALFLLVSQFAVSAEHDLQVAGEIFFTKPLGDASNALAFFAGNLQQGRIFACNFRDGRVTQETNHLAGKVRGAVTFTNKMINLAKNFFAPSIGDGVHDLFEDVSRGGADQIANGIGGDFSTGGCDCLIENGKRVAHGAVAGFGEKGEGIVVRFDFFAGNQVAQLGDDGVEFDGAKAEVLAARADSLRNILRLGRGEHEDDVVGRFLQSLEESVESSVGDLMGFVEDVDFETVASRAISGGFAKFADFVDAAVGGGVDFNDVDRISGANFSARFADSAGFWDRAVFGAAVQRHGQDAGDRRLANTAMPAEDVAMGGTSLFDGVLQRTGNVLLSDDLGEPLRTVFAGQDGVTHGRKSRLYVICGAVVAGDRSDAFDRRDR